MFLELKVGRHFGFWTFIKCPEWESEYFFVIVFLHKSVLFRSM